VSQVLTVLRCWQMPDGVYRLFRVLHLDAREEIVVAEAWTLRRARYCWSHDSYTGCLEVVGEWTGTPEHPFPVAAAVADTFALPLSQVMRRCGQRPPRWRSTRVPPHPFYLMRTPPDPCPDIQRLTWSAYVDGRYFIASLVARVAPQGIVGDVAWLRTTQFISSDHPLRPGSIEYRVDEIAGDSATLVAWWTRFVADPATAICAALLL